MDKHWEKEFDERFGSFYVNEFGYGRASKGKDVDSEQIKSFIKELTN